MIKVGILGASGQLGHMMNKCLAYNGLITVPAFRSDFDVRLEDKYNYFCSLDYLFSQCDVVVNCIGATKPHFNDKSKLTINLFTNSIFPHMLAEWGEKRGKKIIHITTDCVYDGKGTQYRESSIHTATDDYGRSKSLGEPSNCMVIRTSIIGTEKMPNPRFLISWMMSNKDGEVNGFWNHKWSGVTTLQLSKVVGNIIMDKFENLYSNGVSHVFGPDIDKAELLENISEAFKLNVKVKTTLAPEPCDRTLRTNKKLNELANHCGSHLEMLKELASFASL